MTRILFVCHGNICRSPMAEFIMKHLVKQAGQPISVEIDSAATSSEELGNPIYPPALAELARHGIANTSHHARQLTKGDYPRYDLIIGMDSANLRSMQRLFGSDPENKLHLLLDYTDHPHDVADPWYTRNFTTAWNDIEEGCRALLRRLQTDGC